VQHVSDLHPKFGIDIISARLRIGGEKRQNERWKKIEEVTTGQKYNGLPYSIGQPQKGAVFQTYCT